MSLFPEPLFLGVIETLRDIVIIIYGFLGIVFFAAGIALLYIIYRLIRTSAGKATELVDGHVKPLLTTVETTTKSTAATASFISDRTVKPVIQVVSFVAGVRRGASVLLGLTRRTKRTR
jgi:hypothetical protein